MAMQRGLEQRHEQDSRQLIRDTRNLWQRLADFLKSPLAVTITLVGGAAAAILLPGLADLLLILGVGLFLLAISQKHTLPFRLPQSSHLLDYNDPLPGSNKPRKARGIYFFGNEQRSNLELWFGNDDMRTHVLIFGSTGSGKTEALVSMAYNALVQGSGFIYVDGKGDNSLFAKVFSMVRSMGREDDMLLINFMTGAKDVIGPQRKRLSNTLNPFNSGSSSMIAQLVVSLMDSGSGGSDGDMWKGRAIAFVEALMKILVYMRDAGYILLDANTIRNYFTLDRLEAMVLDKIFVRDGGLDSISLENVPPLIMEPINNYVINLPGYNKEKKGKQVSQVLEQHGFITMQLTRVFTSLADTYGHILRTRLAEVDFSDVVLNRRILVVLLPALEKSPDELATLGKVIIASLRAMMAAGLGDAVEGEYRDVIQRKPTNSPSPYLCILDEYGYYAVKGFAVVPAQARSLGFSVVFAGQDLPAFQKASKEEAASIGANTNIKICMKLEDPMETWDFFMKTAGESYVTHVESFQADAKGLTNTYQDTKSARVEKRARVDLLDLKEQREGEAHIFFKSKVVRAKMFYASPQPVKVMRLNHFLKIETPTDTELNKLLKSFERAEELSKSSDIFETPPSNEDVAAIANELQNHQTLPPIERAVAALMAFHDQHSTEDKVEAVVLAENELNIFTGLRLSEQLKSVLLVKEVDTFSQPILEHEGTLEQIQYLQRLLGTGGDRAQSVATEIIRDMETATYYPPKIESKPEATELTDLCKTLTGQIRLKKEESAKAD